jgi:CheY-like chemotaxis protein
VNILVVDDVHDAADSLAAVLKAAGYDAKVAYSAKDAGAQVASGFHPDVVFLDICLPETNGFALAKELCATLPRRPLLIAVTGHPETAERAKREGFDLHFLKPADPEALIDVLEAHAERLRGVRRQ